MLDKVKIALRISHNLLDDDILATIGTARAELKRLGISDILADSEDDNLIVMAIKTYCLYIYADASRVEGYFTSWQYQIDNLRKTSKYIGG